MASNIVHFPRRSQKLGKNYARLAMFMWLDGMDTYEIAQWLGVRSEALVYNSLSEVRDKIHKAKARGKWQGSAKPT